jgi:hypothetical protein
MRYYGNSVAIENQASHVASDFHRKGALLSSESSEYLTSVGIPCDFNADTARIREITSSC